MKDSSEGRIVQDFLRQELHVNDNYPFETMYIVRAFYRWLRWKILLPCYKHAWDAAMKHKVQEWLTDTTLNKSDQMHEEFQKFLVNELGETPKKQKD